MKWRVLPPDKNLWKALIHLRNSTFGEHNVPKKLYWGMQLMDAAPLGYLYYAFSIKFTVAKNSIILVYLQVSDTSRLYWPIPSLLQNNLLK